MLKNQNCNLITHAELFEQMSATQILYLLGETLLLDMDEKAEIEYEHTENPSNFVFKSSIGKILKISATEVQNIYSNGVNSVN